MPIEDADRVHSKRGADKATIKFFNYEIGLMKLMTIVGVGVAGIFILISIYMMMTPPPVIDNTTNETPKLIINDTRIRFDVVTTNYNYRIIKLTYIENKTINNFQQETLLSLYPPQSPHYVARQAVQNDDNVTVFNDQYNEIYIYTGLDNAFHMSYKVPTYSECTDFLNGDWGVNMDDNITKKNMYKFKFNITNSKTFVIESGSSINETLKSSQDYSTFFVYAGIYKERISVMRPVRLVGINNPIIDAGGLGPDLSLHSSNNYISGLSLMNSGNKEFLDGGIVIMPGSVGNNITKNTIYQTIYGIWVYESQSNTITSNTLRNNDKSGIMLVGASSNTITSNNIYNNANGIYADSKSDLNTIRENTVHDNLDYGIIIESYRALRNICEYNIATNNKMSCSDSIDRNQNPVVQTTMTPRVTPTPDDWWSDCSGNPKCYQSDK